MIVTVRDRDILSNLDPIQLTAYLQAQGWYQESQIDRKESVWVKTGFHRTSTFHKPTSIDSRPKRNDRPVYRNSYELPH